MSIPRIWGAKPPKYQYTCFFTMPVLKNFASSHSLTLNNQKLSALAAARRTRVRAPPPTVKSAAQKSRVSSFSSRTFAHMVATLYSGRNSRRESLAEYRRGVGLEFFLEIISEGWDNWLPLTTISQKL